MRRGHRRVIAAWEHPRMDSKFELPDDMRVHPSGHLGPWDRWARAHKLLSEAEIEVVHWQLRHGGPVPARLTDLVRRLRRQAEALFPPLDGER
jgi:hypothetical protein